MSELDFFCPLCGNMYVAANSVSSSPHSESVKGLAYKLGRAFGHKGHLTKKVKGVPVVLIAATAIFAVFALSFAVFGNSGSPSSDSSAQTTSYQAGYACGAALSGDTTLPSNCLNPFNGLDLSAACQLSSGQASQEAGYNQPEYEQGCDNRANN